MNELPVNVYDVCNHDMLWTQYRPVLCSSVPSFQPVRIVCLPKLVNNIAPKYSDMQRHLSVCVYAHKRKFKKKNLYHFQEIELYTGKHEWLKRLYDVCFFCASNEYVLQWIPLSGCTAKVALSVTDGGGTVNALTCIQHRNCEFTFVCNKSPDRCGFDAE